jgi:hypothetical protein
VAALFGEAKEVGDGMPFVTQNLPHPFHGEHDVGVRPGFLEVGGQAEELVIAVRQGLSGNEGQEPGLKVGSFERALERAGFDFSPKAGQRRFGVGVGGVVEEVSEAVLPRVAVNIGQRLHNRVEGGHGLGAVEVFQFGVGFEEPGAVEQRLPLGLGGGDGPGSLEHALDMLGEGRGSLLRSDLARPVDSFVLIVFSAPFGVLAGDAQTEQAPHALLVAGFNPQQPAEGKIGFGWGLRVRLPLAGEEVRELLAVRSAAAAVEDFFVAEIGRRGCISGGFLGCGHFRRRGWFGRLAGRGLAVKLLSEHLVEEPSELGLPLLNMGAELSESLPGEGEVPPPAVHLDAHRSVDPAQPSP